MSKILKNLRKSAAVMVVAGALAPQFAMAHGGGGMGGGHMSAPSYHRAPAHTVKKATTSTSIVNKYPVPPKQLLGQNTTTTSGIGSVVNKYPVPPKQLLGQNTTTTSGIGSVVNKYPVPPKQLLGQNTTTTSGIGSIINKYPTPIKQLLNPSGGTTPIPTPPTCPSGNCYGGFPLGFGLFGLGYGTGYGGFGGYGYTSSGSTAVAAAPAATQTVDSSATPDVSASAQAAPTSPSDNLTPAQAEAVLTALVNLVRTAH